MFDDLVTPEGGAIPNKASELLEELEGNTPEKIWHQRSHERIRLKAKLVVQPGNTSDLTKLKVQGVTADISSSGCQALLPLPLRVGDIYRLTFDGALRNLPLTFARCLRCRQVREDAYEVGCTFFSTVDLSDATATL